MYKRQVYDWQLALLSLLFTPVSYVCAVRMKKPVQRAGAAYKKAVGALSAATLDRAQNAVTYRIHGCEDARAERYEDTLKNCETAAVRSSVQQSALPPLYLAVSNAGGLGIIAAMNSNAAQLRAEIEKCRAKTDKPFGVNLMLMNPCADEMAQIIIEEGVQVVTTGAGSPGKYIPAWKAAGIKVLPVVAASILAKRLVNQGADAIIAEGMESGGHVGEMTTMALVPQVVDAVSIPVIAAGGIADGRQLAAALALGACGVQVGTCLLASEECPIHPNYKAALLKAGDSDTIVTGRTVGAPVRVLKNRMSREYVRQEKAGADKMELEKYTLGSLRRAVFEGDTVSGSLMAGQVAGMLHEVRPLSLIHI